MDDSESDSDDFGVRKPPAHELTSDQMKEAKHAFDQIRVQGTAAVRMIKSDTLGDTAAWVELDEDSCVAWATSHAEHKSAVTQLDTSLGYGRGETSRCNTRTLVAGDYVRAENQADEWKTVPEIVNGQARRSATPTGAPGRRPPAAAVTPASTATYSGVHSTSTYLRNRAGVRHNRTRVCCSII